MGYQYSYTQQIGIGTATPKAALDIVSTTQGLLPPRATGAQILSMTVGTEQNGMLVYATATSGSINKIGYWYYDHTITSWKPFANDYIASNGATMSSNTFKLGGTLTEATTISGLTATNKMSFIGTGVDAFNIDGATFSVDATNDRVGIGTAAPQSKLHVAGNTSSDGGSEGITLSLPNLSANHNFALRLIDNVTGFGNGDLFRTSIINNGSEQFTVSSGGNVGVGTTAPTAKLHINAASAGTGFRLVDGSQSNNRILMSDVNGNASWKEVTINRISGVLGTGVNLNLVNNYTTFYQTGSYIDLPVGKWEVSIDMLFPYTGGTLNNSDWIWLRTGFSDTNGANPAITTDILGGRLISGSFHGPAVTSFQNKYGMMSGRVVLNNTSGATKRYYYVAGGMDTSNASTLSGYLDKFGGNSWSENIITAVSIQ